MAEQSDCANHSFQRSYVVNEMVVWECSTCEAVEYENYGAMDDEGWAWPKTYYKSSYDEVA